MVLEISSALLRKATFCALLKSAKRERPKWGEFFIGPGRLADEYVQFSGRKVRDVMTRDM